MTSFSLSLKLGKDIIITYNFFNILLNLLFIFCINKFCENAFLYYNK